MIRCQACDEENLLTAVFCRSCGEKIDHSSIKPGSEELYVEEESVEERTGGMKRLIRMVVVGVALFLFLWLGKRMPRVNSPDAIQGVLALFVSVIVTVEMLIEVVLSGAATRLIPWVIVLLAFTAVSKTSWPAAASLGIVATAVVICETIKQNRPVIIPHADAGSGD